MVQAEASNLAHSIEAQLKADFERIRSQHYNPNTKGYSYERALRDFLDGYLGGVLDFHVRAQLVDATLRALAGPGAGDGEFDVAATFKPSVPKLVIKLPGATFVPYDAVAFVVEVKQRLTLAGVKRDLEKLARLSELPLSNDRFGLLLGGDYVVPRPLRMLFYYEGDPLRSAVHERLAAATASWDLLFAVKRELTLISPQLRIHTEFGDLVRGFPLLHFLFLAAVIMPLPVAVKTGRLFATLLSVATQAS